MEHLIDEESEKDQHSEHSRVSIEKESLHMNLEFESDNEIPKTMDSQQSQQTELELGILGASACDKVDWPQTPREQPSMLERFRYQKR